VSLAIVLFVATALLFDYLNGFHDSSNIVATMISSRAMSPRQALTIAAACEFVGPFVFGVAVATTVGHEVLAVELLTLPVVSAALISAVLWNLATWYYGIPSSSSHALIGGMVGSGLTISALHQAEIGFSSTADLIAVIGVIQRAGILKVLVALVVSPLLGLSVGFVVMKITRFLLRASGPGANRFFRKGQLVTAIGLALSHGTNDAQKTMGIITMGLLAAGVLPTFDVPWWVVAMSATAIAAGTATGGWRLIRTLGGKFYKIRPVHGLTSQVSSAGVILGAALLGGPVSTTQVVSSAIMGVGSAERINKVRWGVGKQIALTWVITIPATAVVAGLVFCVVRSLT
jgi:PiT family inorganic phosphate transporter